MGNILYSFIEDAILKRPYPEKKILVLGFDGAGKTTILYQLNQNIAHQNITIGFNTEMITFKNLNFLSWDINPHKFFHLLCQQYYEHTKGNKNFQKSNLYSILKV